MMVDTPQPLPRRFDHDASLNHAQGHDDCRGARHRRNGGRHRRRCGGAGEFVHAQQLDVCAGDLGARRSDDHNPGAEQYDACAEHHNAEITVDRETLLPEHGCRFERKLQRRP